MVVSVQLPLMMRGGHNLADAKECEFKSTDVAVPWLDDENPDTLTANCRRWPLIKLLALFHFVGQRQREHHSDRDPITRKRHVDQEYQA